MKFQTKQEFFWKGKFGDQYIKRNNAKSPNPISNSNESVVSNRNMITVMNPNMAIIQNRRLGFSSDKNPAKIAVESGTAASTMPPFPAGIVCMATAVKIGNPKTTPIAVMANLVKSDLPGKFSNLR